jgi:hypothetical protein
VGGIHSRGSGVCNHRCYKSIVDSDLDMPYLLK